MIKKAIKDYAMKHNISETKAKGILSKELFYDKPEYMRPQYMKILIDKRKSIRIDQIIVICDTLGISPSELLNYNKL